MALTISSTTSGSQLRKAYTPSAGASAHHSNRRAGRPAARMAASTPSASTAFMAAVAPRNT
jgi:hypothetical protein